METQCYNIHMKTPIGIKYGKITFAVSGDKISGQISLMNHCEPFSGTIDEFGYCHINGHIVTLIRNIDIYADGRIYNGSLNLSAKGGRNVFEITGTQCKEGVEQKV